MQDLGKLRNVVRNIKELNVAVLYKYVMSSNITSSELILVTFNELGLLYNFKM